MIVSLILVCILFCGVRDVATTSIRLGIDDKDVIITASSNKEVKSVAYEACANFDLTDEQCRNLLMYFEEVFNDDTSRRGSDGEASRTSPPPVHLLRKPPAEPPLHPTPLLKPEYVLPHHPIYSSFPTSSETLASIMSYEPSEDLPSELASAALSAAVASMKKSQLPPPDLYSFLVENSLDPTISECILVQIISSDVYVLSPNERLHDKASFWRQRRRNDVIGLLSNVAAQAKGLLLETELIFCPTDCLGPLFSSSESSGFPADYSFGGPQQNFSYPPRPSPAAAVPLIFSPISCSNAPALSIPVFTQRSSDEPSRDEFPAFAARMLSLQEKEWGDVAVGPTRNETATGMNQARDDPRDRRVRRAIFRGEVSGKSCWIGDSSLPVVVPSSSRSCGRRLLSSLASASPASRYLDVSIGHYVPLLEQRFHRLLMHVEGHCGWSDRLKYELFMSPSCVVLQHSFCQEWYAGGLLPWVHYLPVDYHFHNLEQLLEWGLDDANQDVVDKIVKNKIKYATIVLSLYGVKRYTLELVNGYTVERRKNSSAAALAVKRRDGSEEAALYLARTKDLAQIVIPTEQP